MTRARDLPPSRAGRRGPAGDAARGRHHRAIGRAGSTMVAVMVAVMAAWALPAGAVQLLAAQAPPAPDQPADHALFLPLLHTPPSLLEADSTALRDAVTADGIRGHLVALQEIAGAHGGNRANDTAGFTHSLAYLDQALRDAGYRTYTQTFPIGLPRWELTAPPRLQAVAPVSRTFAADQEFLPLVDSGSGVLTATVVAVDLTLPIPPADAPLDSGCDPDDYGAVAPGALVLVAAADCTFTRQAQLAAAAGAQGLLIVSRGVDEFNVPWPQPGVLAGDMALILPAVGLSPQAGAELLALAATGPVTVHLTVAGRRYQPTGVNLLAESVAGSAAQVVMAGAHLDSVQAGPGINDNGSGSAALLEIARQLAALEVTPRQQLRLAWWGGEELGALGSTAYLESLSSDQIAAIGIYLNFDMVGSTNYFRGIYSGLGQSNAHRAATRLFQDAFTVQGLYSELYVPAPRSDHAPFVRADVPVGGLFAGADGIMDAEQAVHYPHAQVDQPYAPCYHLSCDTLDAVSLAALDEFGDAMAHAIYAFAVSRRWQLPRLPDEQIVQ